MTIWALVLITSTGSSAPVMISSARVTAHYSTQEACAEARAIVLADLALGNVRAGGVECIPVKYASMAKKP